MLAENSYLQLAPEGTYGTYSEASPVTVYVETLTPKTDAGLVERNDLHVLQFETYNATQIAWRQDRTFLLAPAFHLVAVYSICE